jgi:hypothetical protein
LDQLINYIIKVGFFSLVNSATLFFFCCSCANAKKPQPSQTLHAGRPLLIVQDSLGLQELAAMLRKVGHTDTVFLSGAKKEDLQWYDHSWLSALGAIIAVVFSVVLNFASSKRLAWQQASYQKEIAKEQGGLQERIASAQGALNDRIAASQLASQERLAQMQIDQQRFSSEAEARFEMENLRARGLLENQKMIFEKKTEVVLLLPGVLQQWVRAVPIDNAVNQYTPIAFMNNNQLIACINEVAKLNQYGGILGTKTMSEIVKLNSFLIKISERHLNDILLQSIGRSKTEEFYRLINSVIATALEELKDEISTSVGAVGLRTNV